MIDPSADGWEAMDDPGFIGLVGPVFRRACGEHDEYGFRADPKHANMRHVVQGGMLMTFADRAFGRTAWQAAGRGVATVQFDMQFVSAARGRLRGDPAGGRAPHRRARLHARHAPVRDARRGDGARGLENPGLRDSASGP
jgi:acyl-coenzyme A thioesterase PaaI-like protein